MLTAALRGKNMEAAWAPSLLCSWRLHCPGHLALLCCRYAVRRVVFSPHAENVVASCSYDMTVRLWDVAAPEDALLQVWDHHSEFAVGLDLSTLSKGMMASAGWDGLSYVWHQKGDPRH